MNPAGIGPFFPRRTWHSLKSAPSLPPQPPRPIPAAAVLGAGAHWPRWVSWATTATSNLGGKPPRVTLAGCCRVRAAFVGLKPLISQKPLDGNRLQLC